MRHFPTRRKRRSLALLSLGYGGSMLAFRGTLLLSLPAILEDASDRGRVVSTCQLTYMVVKPVVQALSDDVDARTMLLASEVSTAVVFACLPLASSLRGWQVLVAALMACQAPHAPAATRLLTSHFEQHERGAAFSTMNAATNLVSCVLPFVVVRGTQLLGSWRRLYVTIAAAVAGIALIQALAMDVVANDDVVVGGRETKKPESEEDHLTRPGRSSSSSSSSSLVLVLRRRIVWVLGANYALMAFVRMGVEGWIGTYLADQPRTAAFLFWWQLGGFAGASVAGPASDARGGYPALLSAGLGLGLLAALAVLDAATRSQWLNAIALCAGACVYAIKVCLTLATRLHFPPRDCGKADAVTNALMELGGAVAGLPLISLVQRSDSNMASYGPVLTVAAGLLCLAQGALLFDERRERRCSQEAKKLR